MAEQDDLIFFGDELSAYDSVYQEVLIAVGSFQKSKYPQLSNDEAINAAVVLLERQGITRAASAHAASQVQKFLLSNRGNPKLASTIHGEALQKVTGALSRAHTSVKQITAGATAQAAAREINAALKKLGSYSDAALRAEAKRSMKLGPGEQVKKAALFSSLVRQLTSRPVLKGQRPSGKDPIQSALGRIGFGTTKSPNTSGLGLQVENLNSRGKGDLALALVVSTLYKDASGLRIVDGKFVGGKLRSASEIVSVGKDISKLAEILDADNKPGTVSERMTRGVLQLLKENPSLWRSVSDRKIDAKNIGNIGEGPPKSAPTTKKGAGAKSYYDSKNDKLYSWDQTSRKWVEAKAAPIQITRKISGSAALKGTVFSTLKNFESENRDKLREAATQVNRANEAQIRAALRSAEEERELRKQGGATRRASSARAGARRAELDLTKGAIGAALAKYSIGQGFETKTFKDAVADVKRQAEVINREQKALGILLKSERLTFEEAITDKRFLAISERREGLRSRLSELMALRDGLKSGAILEGVHSGSEADRRKAISRATRDPDLRGAIGTWKRAGVDTLAKMVNEGPKLPYRNFVEFDEPAARQRERFAAKFKAIEKDIRRNLDAFRGDAPASSLGRAFQGYRRPRGEERRILRRSSMKGTILDLPENVAQLLALGRKGYSESIFTYRTKGGVGRAPGSGWREQREALLRLPEVQAVRDEIKKTYGSNVNRIIKLVKEYETYPTPERKEAVRIAIDANGRKLLALSRLYTGLGGQMSDTGTGKIDEMEFIKPKYQQMEIQRRLVKLVKGQSSFLGKDRIFLRDVGLDVSLGKGKGGSSGHSGDSVEAATKRYLEIITGKRPMFGKGKNGKYIDAERGSKEIEYFNKLLGQKLFGTVMSRSNSWSRQSISKIAVEPVPGSRAGEKRLVELRERSISMHPKDVAAAFGNPLSGKPINVFGVEIPHLRGLETGDNGSGGWRYVNIPEWKGGGMTGKTVRRIEIVLPTGQGKLITAEDFHSKSRRTYERDLTPAEIKAYKESGQPIPPNSKMQVTESIAKNADIFVESLSRIPIEVPGFGQIIVSPSRGTSRLASAIGLSGLRGEDLLSTAYGLIGRQMLNRGTAMESNYNATSPAAILKLVGKANAPGLATDMMKLLLQNIAENMAAQAKSRKLPTAVRETSRQIAAGLNDTVINDLAAATRITPGGQFKLGRQSKAVKEAMGKGGAISQLMGIGGQVGGSDPLSFLGNLFGQGAQTGGAYARLGRALSGVAPTVGASLIDPTATAAAAVSRTRGGILPVAPAAAGGAGGGGGGGPVSGGGGGGVLTVPKASLGNLLGIIEGIEKLATAVTKIPQVAIPKSVTALSDSMNKIVNAFNALNVAKAPPPKKFIEMQNALNNLQKVFDAASKVSVGKGIAGATGKAVAGAAPNITINQGGGGGGGRGKGVVAAPGGAGGAAGGGGGILMGMGGGGSEQPIRDMQNFANQTSGILGNLAAQIKFGFVQQFTSQISQAVGMLLGHLQAGVLGFNAKLENATVAFDTLFENEQKSLNGFVTDAKGAQDQAENLVAEIQRFANVTPFRFPELVESARRMRAFGFATNEILPNLQAIGDAVAALGGEDDKIFRITYALGQMKQAGRVYQNDMMQLANAGIAGYELLSRAVLKDLVKTGDITLKANGKVIDSTLLSQKDAMGNSTVAAKEALSQLNILTNKIAKIKSGTTAQKLAAVGVTVSKSSSAAMKKIFDDIVNNPIQAIRKLTQSGKIEGGAAARAILAEMAAEFGGGMRKLSKTFQGALSTLQDTSQYFVAMITKPIFTGIRDAMIELGYFMQSRAAKEQAQRFAESFEKIIPTVGTLLQNLLNIVTGLGKAFTEMFEKFGTLTSGAAAGADMIGLFLNGVQVLSDAMRNKMVRAFMAAALGFKVLSAALNANKPLVMLVGIITAIGALGEAYEKNTFGFKSFVDEYAGPIQNVVQQMQTQLLPALMEVGSTLAQVFGGAFMESLKLAVPVFTMMLKLVNLLLTALNAIPGASNVLGAALAMYAGGKILGPKLFGSKAVMDQAGNVVKAGGGGLLGALHGGARRAGDAGVALRAGEQLNLATFRAGKAAKSVADVVKSQTKLADKILKDAVKAGVVTAEEAAAASAHYGAALSKAAATTTSVPQMVKMVGGGSMFRGALGEAQGAGRALAVSGGIGNVGSRMSAFIKDIGRAGSSVKQFSASLIDFVKRIFGVLKGVPMAATAAGYGPGAGLLGLGSGVKGGFAAIKQTGFIKSIGNTVKSIGKIGGALAIVSGLADVASGTDPVRAGARVVGGTIGGAIGATIGSIIPVFGTAIGGILGSLAGSFIGDQVSNLAGVRSDQAAGAEVDMTPAEIEAMSFNEALKDGVITMTELNRLGSEFSMTTPDALDLIASGIDPATSTLLPDTYGNITKGLNLTPENIKGDLNTLNVLTDVIEEFYRRQGKQNPRAFAIAELSAYLDQAGQLKSVDALNNALKGLLAQWGIGEDAAAAYGLVISGAADDTQALADATNNAKEALSTLASAMQSRVGAVFEKAMAKAKEKAIDAFLATQEVLVNGQSTNILALKKEIELQDKKNRLAEVEKGIRSATRNVEMARLGLYDASVDPLEAAYRMREAEDAKTEELKKAALERKKIALDEAMASEPVKAGLEHIEELFEAAKMKFQEGMQHILDLVNKGKISGEQAAKMIAALYKTTLGEVGVLDANLDTDARNFGDAFLGTWDSIIKKFKKQVNELRRLLKAATDPGGPLGDLGDNTDTPPGPSGPPGDWSTMPGGRAGDNWRGFGMDPAEIAAMNKAVVDAQKKNVAIRFANMMKVLQNAQMPKNLTFSQQVGWPMAMSRALASFSYGGNMYDLFQRSQKTTDPIAVMKQFNAGKKTIDQIFFPYGNNNPVAGMASGGTIMGSGLFKVGEAGSEMMQVGPAGVARVFPRTYRPIGGIGAVGGGGGGVNASVIINNPTVRNDQDIRKLAEEVSRAQTSLLRSAGIGKV